jgi:hypothetical protein
MQLNDGKTFARADTRRRKPHAHRSEWPPKCPSLSAKFRETILLISGNGQLRISLLDAQAPEKQTYCPPRYQPNQGR